MSALNQFRITWQPREFPLTPVAVAAQGEVSRKLAHRLLSMGDEALTRFEGVAAPRLIMLRGPTELLPWVDGVQYFGVDSAAPSLLLPSTYVFTLPVALVEKALMLKSTLTGTLAVLPDPLSLVPMRSARPVSRQTLASWLEQQ